MKTHITSPISDDVATRSVRPAVAVIGGGYVGLVTAACLSDLGRSVVVIEIDRGKLELLECGRVPIFEPGLEPLIRRNVQAGRLSFTDDYAVIRDVKVAMIAVNTPARPDGRADTSFVFDAVRQTACHASDDLTIVIKSTVPAGTTAAIQGMIRSSLTPPIRVVSNPEFLRQGSAVRDFLEPDRIVIGTDNPVAAANVAALYDGIEAPIVYCSDASAEMAKYVSNALLATRISFLNEIASLCDATRSDIEEVTRIVGLDHRIGQQYLRAGLGWGGSCLPKDTAALTAMAYAHGLRPQILEAVAQVNFLQPGIAVNKLRTAVPLETGTVVGILGLAFKPNTDDLRGAPSVEIISRLLAAGVEVRAHDPVAEDNTRRLFPEITYCTDLYDLAANCDALVLCTEWTEYLAADWAVIRSVMRGGVVLDGRNALDGSQLRALDFQYLSIGRADPVASPSLVELAASDQPVGSKP